MAPLYLFDQVRTLATDGRQMLPVRSDIVIIGHDATKPSRISMQPAANAWDFSLLLTTRQHVPRLIDPRAPRPWCVKRLRPS